MSRLRSVTCLLLVLAGGCGSAVSERPPDRSAPPAVDESAGGFTVRELSGPVGIDGRAWIAAEPRIGAQTFSVSNGAFTISLTDTADVGDVSRFRLGFTAPGITPVALSADPVAYAYLTEDARWLFFEPLNVIDLQRWRRFDLSKHFEIQPYVLPIAVSEDRQRLVVSRRECAFDCADLPTKYYEVGFPAAR